MKHRIHTWSLSGEKRTPPSRHEVVDAACYEAARTFSFLGVQPLCIYMSPNLVFVETVQYFRWITRLVVSIQRSPVVTASAAARTIFVNRQGPVTRSA
jgi:hypothetical protein